MSAPGRWIRRLSPIGRGLGDAGDGGPRPDRPRLVVAPYAGGGAIPFRPWAQALAGRAEVWVLTPPGREARLAEPPVRDWATWLAGAGAALDAVAEGPYVLWGHSLGALAALELARGRRGAGGPRALILSGARPPGRMRWDDPDDLDDAAIADRLRLLGGTPAAVLASEELMALVMPALRADFKLAAAYVDRPAAPLDVPVTALMGVGDRVVPHAELGEWAAVTRGPFTGALFPGDHFFPFAGGAAPAVVDAVLAAVDAGGAR